MHSGRVLAVINQLLLPLLVSKLVGKTRDRAGYLCQTLLLVMLDVQVREHTLHIVRSDPLRWLVVHFLNTGATQGLPLLRHLFLDKLIDLSLQVVLLVNHIVINT